MVSMPHRRHSQQAQVYCYPLTIVDGFSRYLLACHGLLSTAIAPARPIFLRLFQEYGLPGIIRTDNGVPFATTALGRLSTLSVWWIRLGILPELIAPASPQQNGRHERMHRTLKAEATRPPSGNLQAQQVRFNRFRQEYNDERPHEALNQETPASVYRPSARELPRQLAPSNTPDTLKSASSVATAESLEEALGLRHAHPGGRIRRPRGSR